MEILVPKPSNVNIISKHWIFKKKNIKRMKQFINIRPDLS